MIEIIFLAGQFIADNATLFGFAFSLSCVAGTWHMCKKKGDKDDKS